MKAVLCTKYGTPDNLFLTEVDKPVPGARQVLIKVHAVSLNDWDLGLMEGDVVNRILNGIFKPKQTILGSDVAGVIVARGKNVNRFNIGDRVYGDLSGRWGGLAEYVCAGEACLEIIPATMNYNDAAAIPQAAMLAVQGLIDVGKIHSGQTVLVNGAGGGVGTFAVQIAKQYKIEITGVDHAGKLDMLSAMGYDHVMDYMREDFTKTGKQYDLILDAKTTRPVFDYLRALRPNGSYVTVGGSLPRLFQAMLMGPLISRFTAKHIKIVTLKPNKDLGYINALYDAGLVRPVIDGLYTLEATPDAFRHLLKAGHKGKVVITINGTS